jgi:hypothetical protein
MRPRSFVSLIGLVVVACGRPLSPPVLGALPFATDTTRVERVADGVWYRYLYAPSGPWAIHVLDVDLSRCNAVVAAKGSWHAPGRTRTTAILDSVARRSGGNRIVGGVNADFFSLADGTPTGLLVVDGQMMTPASREPVFAIDSAGRPRLGTFTRQGTRLLPFWPRDAVGGHPILVRDSVVTGDVDTDGNAGFRGRNPRTAVGIGRNGRRLLLVVIDGRQKPYSDGASLRETANILLALGARDALNLDGGGSSTMVVERRVANRPSDSGGERAVGDAVAIVNRCSASR